MTLIKRFATGPTYTMQVAVPNTLILPLALSATITVTWPAAFPNTNYGVVATLLIPAALAMMGVVQVESKTTTNCVLRVVNLNPTLSITPTGATIDVVATKYS